VPEAPGTNCEFGGTKIESGLDTNGDGILQQSEVTSTSYVCNGAPGDAGASGAKSLITITPVPVNSLQCQTGGQEIQTGIDTNGDGILEPSEVQNTAFVCNGASQDLCPSPTSLCVAKVGGTLFCASLATDPNNCGACGTVCGNGTDTVSCVGGVCTFAGCDPGFANCDGNAANGCETNVTNDPNNCGACADACVTTNGTPACVGSACTIASCNQGFGNCDGNAADGCEANLSNDPNNCGVCGKVCTGPNGTETCASGACKVAVCNAGFGDCDGNPANGCEVNLTNNPNNCGQCGNVCSGGCISSSCCGGATAVCTAPIFLGNLPLGTTGSPYTGTLPTATSQNWLAVTFSGNTTTTYHPKIVIASSDNSFVFDVERDCTGTNLESECNVAGDATTSAGITAWETFYTAGDPNDAPDFDAIPAVGAGGTVFIRVYRKTGSSQACTPYTVSFSN
jgi:hypothetical protein